MLQDPSAFLYHDRYNNVVVEATSFHLIRLLWTRLCMYALCSVLLHKLAHLAASCPPPTSLHSATSCFASCSVTELSDVQMLAKRGVRTANAQPVELHLAHAAICLWVLDQARVLLLQGKWCSMPSLNMYTKGSGNSVLKGMIKLDVHHGFSVRTRMSEQ